MVFSVGRRAGLAPPIAAEAAEDDEDDAEAILEVELHRELLAARLRIFKEQSC